MKAAATETNGATFMLTISLGLRRGEVFGLHREDVDLDAGRQEVRRQLKRRRRGTGRRPEVILSVAAVAVPISDRRRARARRVPDEAVAADVAAAIAAGGCPATAPAGALEGASPRGVGVGGDRARRHERVRAANRPVRQLGPLDCISRLPPHPGGPPARRARHTAATLLLVQGVDQRVVTGIFGWTSPTMTTRYQHVVPELVDAAGQRISELLWGGSQQSGSTS